MVLSIFEIAPDCVSIDLRYKSASSERICSGVRRGNSFLANACPNSSHRLSRVSKKPFHALRQFLNSSNTPLKFPNARYGLVPQVPVHLVTGTPRPGALEPLFSSRI